MAIFLNSTSGFNNLNNTILEKCADDSNIHAKSLFTVQEYFLLFTNSFLTLVELISSGQFNKILNKNRKTRLSDPDRVLWTLFVTTL